MREDDDDTADRGYNEAADSTSGATARSSNRPPTMAMRVSSEGASPELPDRGVHRRDCLSVAAGSLTFVQADRVGRGTHVAPISGERRPEICQWCGHDLPDDPDADRAYCKRTHAKKAQRRRTSLVQAGSRPCPTPHKAVLVSRGEAFRGAVEHQQYPYACPCGSYHLTRQRHSGQ